MLEMFTRTYVDTSKFPSKVKMDTLKKKGSGFMRLDW